MAVDATGLYALGLQRGERVLYRVAKDGTGIQALARYSSTTDIAWEWLSNRIGLDAAGVYVSRRSGFKRESHEALLRVPRDGGAPEVVAERFGRLGAVHRGYAYGLVRDFWGERDEAVVRVALGGGEVTTLFRRKLGRVSPHGATFRFQELAVDDDGVFVSDQGEERVFRLPLAGGAAVVVAPDITLPRELWTAGDFIFLAEGVMDGELSVLPKAGGKREKTELHNVWAVTADGDRLYVFGGTEKVNRGLFVFQQGSAPVHRGRTEHIQMGEAVADEDCLYYVRVDPSGVSWFDAIAKPVP